MFTRYALFVGIILWLSGFLAACATRAAPTPVPAIAALPDQPAPTASATPAPAPTPTEAPTATPPATPTEAPTPTPPATATPAPSPTPAPTERPAPTAVKEAVTLPIAVGVTYEGQLTCAGKDCGEILISNVPDNTGVGRIVIYYVVENGGAKFPGGSDRAVFQIDENGSWRQEGGFNVPGRVVDVVVTSGSLGGKLVDEAAPGGVASFKLTSIGNGKAFFIKMVEDVYIKGSNYPTTTNPHDYPAEDMKEGFGFSGWGGSK